jgi:hypothetical protein
LTTTGLGSAGIQITGTWAGTLEFDGTVDGTNWIQIRAVQFGGTLVGGTTVNGLFFAQVGGLLKIRIYATSWTSGTATIYIEGTAATNAITLANSLPVGTNSIGILGANSGVDIGDVTINNAVGAGVYVQPGTSAVFQVQSNSANIATETTLSTINTKLVTGTDIGDVTINNASGDSAVNIQDGGNSITIDGTITVGTMANLTESLVDDAGFTPATSRVLPVGFELDDVSPDSVNEGDIGAGRMSANRNQYVQIRDNAGNERGLNIDASGNIILGTGSNAIGKLATNSGIDIGDVDITSIAAGTNIIGAVKRDIVNYTKVQKYATASTAQTDTVIWDPTNGTKFVITDILISVDTAMNVHLEDGTTIIFKWAFAANGGCSTNLQTPFQSASANNNLTYTSSAVGNIYITILGYEV